MGEAKDTQKYEELVELRFISSGEMKRYMQRLYETQVGLLLAKRKDLELVLEETDEEQQGGFYGLN